jgi:hypothetical protein
VTDKKRAAFEAEVIKRFQESGYLEVQIRVECLGRSGDGYQDGSVDAYWDFWNAGRSSVVVELPAALDSDRGWTIDRDEAREAIIAAGGSVAP